ncbi:response regulator transcription factor [Ohtaekwangia sp.]|jgi:DNA-binding NarL/FixJ family response regulator|uniref:response regulator transcription factor n=1 Tax=Ohtaekwangia sp. TaxID=2066019 RepID=UPI002F9283C6
MSSIRAIVVDDHGLVRQGIVSLLRESGEVEILKSVDSGEEAVNMATEYSPDIVLMDIVMKGMTGIEATRWIKEQNPQIKVILLSSEVNKDFIRAGLRSGMDGYLNKDSTSDLLLKAIHSVMKGEKFFGPDVTSLVFDDFSSGTKPKDNDVDKGERPKSSILSKREEEVLALIAEGKSLRQIGEELFISVKTVETHKLHIQDKLGLSSTAQLVRYALERKNPAR